MHEKFFHRLPSLPPEARGTGKLFPRYQEQTIFCKGDDSLKLGISGQALAGTYSIDKIIGIIKGFGVSHLEVWGENLPLVSTGYPGGYDNKDLEGFKKLCDEQAMSVGCVTMGGAFDKELTADAETYAKALVGTVKAAKFLGAKVVNHYCFHLSMGETPDIERLKRYLSPALDKAVELGITLAMENEAHDSTATPEGMLNVINAFGSQNFKTNYDATNYYHASCEGFPYAYEVLKEHIAYVHIKNGCLHKESFGRNEESKGSPMGGYHKGGFIYYPTISEGAVNIDGLLMRLKADGYDGLCTLEPHTQPNNVGAYYASEVGYLRSRGHF